MLVVTPRNVIARLFVSLVLILGGLQIMAQPQPGALAIGLPLLLLGSAIGFYGARWFWRLFIVAWFR